MLREVKVRREELLEIVRKNRESHRKEYLEAVDGYKEMAKETVRDQMENLSERLDLLKKGEVIPLLAVYFNLEVPQDHTSDYDQVIKMLEMSVDDTLTVRADEFAEYVMDNWSWSEHFKTVAMNYSNSSSSRKPSSSSPASQQARTLKPTILPKALDEGN